MAVFTGFFCHLSPMPHTGYNVLPHLGSHCRELELYTLMLTVPALPIHSPTEPEQWEGADVLGLRRQPEDPEEAATQGGGAEEEGGGGPCSSHQGVLEDCKEMTVFVSIRRHNCCTHLPCAKYESNWTRFFQLPTVVQYHVCCIYWVYIHQELEMIRNIHLINNWHAGLNTMWDDNWHECFITSVLWLVVQGWHTKGHPSITLNHSSCELCGAFFCRSALNCNLNFSFSSKVKGGLYMCSTGAIHTQLYPSPRLNQRFHIWMCKSSNKCNEISEVSWKQKIILSSSITHRSNTTLIGFGNNQTKLRTISVAILLW